MGGGEEARVFERGWQQQRRVKRSTHPYRPGAEGMLASARPQHEDMRENRDEVLKFG